MKLNHLLSAVLVFCFISAVSAQTKQYRNSAQEEMVGNLSNQVRLLQDENSKLAATVYSLQREMKELKQRIGSYQAELEELRRQISAESDARKKQLNNIADSIQQAGERAAENSRTAAEEYDFYVVEAGATLSAVSRATGISISELKRVNGMKNDVLRIGQKLKIPRK